MGFAHERGGAIVDPANPPFRNGYDEVAVKRIEKQLVELGTTLQETQAKVAYLEGALDEGTPRELLHRIRSHAAESEGDMSRLMCEAQRLMRGA